MRDEEQRRLRDEREANDDERVFQVKKRHFLFEKKFS